MTASLRHVAEFFGGPISAFSTEWKALSDTDKEQLKNGIGDGSLTY